MNCEISVDRLDHLVLTVADVEAACFFYQKALGMKIVEFGNGRKALSFGSQKINLHEKGREFEPKASVSTPGSADLCFITTVPLSDALRHLENCGIAVIEGPVRRTGATGPINSIYFRDPDLNLIELSNCLEA